MTRGGVPGAGRACASWAITAVASRGRPCGHGAWGECWPPKPPGLSLPPRPGLWEGTWGSGEPRCVCTAPGCLQRGAERECQWGEYPRVRPRRGGVQGPRPRPGAAALLRSEPGRGAQARSGAAQQPGGGPHRPAPPRPCPPASPPGGGGVGVPGGRRGRGPSPPCGPRPAVRVPPLAGPATATATGLPGLRARGRPALLCRAPGGRLSPDASVCDRPSASPSRRAQFASGFRPRPRHPSGLSGRAEAAALELCGARGASPRPAGPDRRQRTRRAPQRPPASGPAPRHTPCPPNAPPRPPLALTAHTVAGSRDHAVHAQLSAHDLESHPPLRTGQEAPPLLRAAQTPPGPAWTPAASSAVLEIRRGRADGLPALRLAGPGPRLTPHPAPHRAPHRPGAQGG